MKFSDQSIFQKKQKYDLFNNKIYELVECGKIVLDIGCATGKLLENLKKNKNCQVFGIESDKEMAKEAARICENLICDDVESCNLPFQKEFFDIIIFADVLEHLKRPDLLLEKLKFYIKRNGCLLISIPNIAFFLARLNLFFGKFDYVEYGIMDKTHLRFFTLKTAKRLIEESGYKIVYLQGYNQVKARYFLLKPLGKIFKTLFATDFIIKAVIK